MNYTFTLKKKKNKIKYIITFYILHINHTLILDGHLYE